MYSCLLIVVFDDIHFEMSPTNNEYINFQCIAIYTAISFIQTNFQPNQFIEFLFQQRMVKLLKPENSKHQILNHEQKNCLNFHTPENISVFNYVSEIRLKINP